MLLQTARPLRPVFRWLWYTELWWEWPPGGFETMSGFEYCQIMQDMNETTHHRLEIWFLISVLRLYRGTLLRCRGGRWFTFRLILIQLSLPKSDLKVIAYLSFRLRNFQHEKRAPGEASRRHTSSRERCLSCNRDMHHDIHQLGVILSQALHYS